MSNLLAGSPTTPGPRSRARNVLPRMLARAVPSRRRRPGPGRQGKLVPPCLGVAALTPGEVRGEILDMDLHPRPVGGERVQEHATFLENQGGLPARGHGV